MQATGAHCPLPAALHAALSDWPVFSHLHASVPQEVYSARARLHEFVYTHPVSKAGLVPGSGCLQHRRNRGCGAGRRLLLCGVGLQLTHRQSCTSNAL